MFDFVKKAAAVTIFVTASSGAALAASQGAVGSNSSGAVDVRAVIPGLVKISNLNDIDLGTWSGTGDMSGNDDLCVWSSTRGYNLTASGSGSANAFTITDGENEIAYSVSWDDTDTTEQALTNGETLVAQVTTAVSTNCAARGDTAAVAVSIAETDAAAAQAGSYSGTLTLIVSPE